MTIIFKYVHIPREDKTLRHAPFIKILAEDAAGKKIELLALVDSGADSIVIPRDLAEVLGLKLGEEQETAGIGGKTKVRRTRFMFTVRSERESYRIVAPALVLMDDGMDVPLILGRNGFFEAFDITFRQTEEKLFLKKR
ncbi:retropepsin-like domain-containing protein [Candidatus Woesearchaeota archaeon]|nr:retropepsin-like domain-containing protein [Candidatus Woesearchaeota archaeon]